MKKSWTISILFILIFGLATPVSGDEFADKNPLTEEMQIASMIENSKSLSSDSLEIIKKDKNVLAVYGSIPDSKEGVESYEWWNSICGVVDSISAEEALEKYLYRSGGPIIGYGPNSTGYILVRIYSMYEKELTIEDFENIYSIIQEHSSKYNIDNPPVVFRSMDMPKAYSYTDRFRPVIGGLRITTGAGSGTVGFAAQRTNVSNSTGFVTAAHIVDFSSQELYQPAISLLRNNSVGFSTLYNTKIDAVFVPHANITDGENNLTVYYKNDTVSIDDTYLPVGGYYSLKSVNDLVHKSGIETQYTNGTLTEYVDHYSLDDSGTVYSLDTGGIITPNIADHGDSGGPVFVIRDDGKAYMVGIISGGIDNENDSYTVFAPCYEIKLKLNVVPLLR